MALRRRRFLGLFGGAVGASVVGTSGIVGLDGRLRHKLEDEWAYADGPDLTGIPWAAMERSSPPSEL